MAGKDATTRSEQGSQTSAAADESLTARGSLRICSSCAGPGSSGSTATTAVSCARAFWTKTSDGGPLACDAAQVRIRVEVRARPRPSDGASALDAGHGDQARGNQIPLTAVPVGGRGGSGGSHGWRASGTAVSHGFFSRGVDGAWAKMRPLWYEPQWDVSSPRGPAPRSRVGSPVRPRAELTPPPVAPGRRPPSPPTRRRGRPRRSSARTGAHAHAPQDGGGSALLEHYPAASRTAPLTTPR